MFGFQRLVCFFRFSSLGICHKIFCILPFIWCWCSSAPLNSTTTLSIWKQKTVRIFLLMNSGEYCSIHLKHQIKAWLKLWFYPCVVSAVCMQLNTHHWDFLSRSFRSICGNVYNCTCAFMCLYIASTIVEQKKTQKGWIQFFFGKFYHWGF